MTDLRTLADAFTELERQGEAAAQNAPLPTPGRRRPSRFARSAIVTGAGPTDPARVRRVGDAEPRRRSRRLVPIAAAAVVVAGVAVSVGLLAPSEETGGTQVAAPPQSASDRAPAAEQPAAEVPTTPAELEDRLREALPGAAAFTVTDTGAPMVITVPGPGDQAGAGDKAGAGDQAGSADARPGEGAAIVGLLTAGGETGGYDLNVYRATASDIAPQCGGLIDCDINERPDGTIVVSGSMEVTGPAAGVTHEVTVYTADGIVRSMHVSNQQSPKGESRVLGAEPPLDVAEITAVLLADTW